MTDEHTPLFLGSDSAEPASEHNNSEANTEPALLTLRSSSRAEAQPWFRWLQDTVPFVLLLLAVFLERHFVVILAISWLSTVLHTTNVRIRQQLSNHGASIAMPLLLSFLIVSQILSLFMLSGVCAPAHRFHGEHTHDGACMRTLVLLSS